MASSTSRGGYAKLAAPNGQPDDHSIPWFGVTALGAVHKVTTDTFRSIETLSNAIAAYEKGHAWMSIVIHAFILYIIVVACVLKDDGSDERQRCYFSSPDCPWKIGKNPTESVCTSADVAEGHKQSFATIYLYAIPVYMMCAGHAVFTLITLAKLLISMSTQAKSPLSTNDDAKAADALYTKCLISGISRLFITTCISVTVILWTFTYAETLHLAWWSVWLPVMLLLFFKIIFDSVRVVEHSGLKLAYSSVNTSSPDPRMRTQS